MVNYIRLFYKLLKVLEYQEVKKINFYTGEIEVDPNFRREMIEREEEVERRLQKQIDDFNEQNSKK